MDENVNIKVNLSGLYLEMTRDCNLSCKHCLRGDAQDAYISNVQINRILDNLNVMENIYLGGGEPFLAKRQIFYLLDQIEERIKNKELLIYTVGMITNGTIQDEEIIDKFDKFATFIIENLFNGNDKNSDGSSRIIISIGISKDEFHDNNPEQAMNWFKQHCNEHTALFFNTFENKKSKVKECNRTSKNNIKTRKVFGIEELHRFTIEDENKNSLIKALKSIDSVLYENDCLAVTTTNRLIKCGSYDFSEVDNDNYPLYMGNYMDEYIYILMMLWNIKHPLEEKHAQVFEAMMRRAMTQTDRDRIKEKFFKKEQAVKEMIKINSDMTLADIYKEVLHF